jgi:hypothetical protein
VGWQGGTLSTTPLFTRTQNSIQLLGLLCGGRAGDGHATVEPHANGSGFVVVGNQLVFSHTAQPQRGRGNGGGATPTGACTYHKKLRWRAMHVVGRGCGGGGGWVMVGEGRWEGRCNGK